MAGPTPYHQESAYREIVQTYVATRPRSVNFGRFSQICFNLGYFKGLPSKARRKQVAHEFYARFIKENPPSQELSAENGIAPALPSPPDPHPQREIPRLDPKRPPESSKNYENIYPKIRKKRRSKRHRADMLDPHTRTNICADHDDFERNFTKLHNTLEIHLRMLQLHMRRCSAEETPDPPDQSALELLDSIIVQLELYLARMRDAQKNARSLLSQLPPLSETALPQELIMTPHPPTVEWPLRFLSLRGLIEPLLTLPENTYHRLLQFLGPYLF